MAFSRGGRTLVGAFDYFLVGCTSGVTYVVAPSKRVAVGNAESLSVSTGEPIRIRNRAGQVIDIYYKGRSVRAVRGSKV